MQSYDVELKPVTVVPADGYGKHQIENFGPDTVYYKADTTVSAASNDGTLLPGATLVAPTVVSFVAQSSAARIGVSIQTSGSVSGFSQLLTAGHSRVAEGGATAEDFGVSHKTARVLEANLSLLAQGGSCLCAEEGASIAGGARYGGIGRLLQFVTNTRTAAPYLPAWQAAILDWGLNDMGWMGPTTFASAFPLALRGAIARLRAGAIFEETDASVAYTGASWSTVGLTSCNSGAGVKQVTANGDKLTITVPADFPGGAINLRFVTGTAGQGALWTVTGTGSCAAVNTTYDSRNVNGFDFGGSRASNGHLLNSVKRLTGLPAGSGTIVVTATTINTVGYFDCWEIESLYAGPVTAGMDARPATYALWAAWPYSAAAGFGDADVTTIWNIVTSVAAEFPSAAGLALDAVFQRNALYFAADGAHWTDLGHALAGNASAGVLQSTASSLSLAQSGGFFKPYFYPLDGTGAGNAYTNSWVNFTGGLPGGYRKDNLTGRVSIRGWATKTTGSATDAIFTLPVGYRPNNTMDFVVPVFNGTTWGTGVLRITAAGVVSLTSGGSIAVGNVNELNVSFQAEQ